MLRQNLGVKKVAFLVWQHGLPSILASPVVKKHNMSMLQSGMECLRWYVSLAKAIVVHETQEGFGKQQLASSKDPEERQRQKSRRQALQKARDGMRLGATLVQQRNNKKRSYDEMNEFE